MTLAELRARYGVPKSIRNAWRCIRGSGDDRWHLCLGLDGSARVMCVYRPPMGF